MGRKYHLPANKAMRRGRGEPQCGQGDGQKKDSPRLERKPLQVESTAHGEEVPRRDREVLKGGIEDTFCGVSRAGREERL